MSAMGRAMRNNDSYATLFSNPGKGALLGFSLASFGKSSSDQMLLGLLQVLRSDNVDLEV